MKPNNAILMSGVSNSGTKHSLVLDAQFILSGSVQAIFSDGAAAGTLTIEGSNDPYNGLAVDSKGIPIPVNWSLVKNGTISATATVASGALTTISMQWFNSRWLRVTWVSSGGAGTLTVNAFMQGA